MTHDDRIEPARSTRSARRRAEFAAAVADKLPEFIVELRREGTVADARGIALTDAYDLVDHLRTNTRADARAARYRVTRRNIRICSEINIKQGSLRPLKEHLLTCLVRIKCDNGNIRKIFRQPLAVSLIFLVNRVKIKHLAAVNLLDNKIFQLARVLNELFQTLGMRKIVHANSNALRLVGVAGPDTAPRSADIRTCLLSLERFLKLVKLSVPRHYDIRARVYAQIIAGNAALVHFVYFLDQHLRVDNDAAADKTFRFGIEDTRREKMQLINIIAVNDGMSRVIAAARADYNIRLCRHYVDYLALALVAPLSTDDYT